jgi:DNA excision repair protein ERCC-3
MNTPIIVNPDLSVFVMRDSERYAEARDLMLMCAQLDKSPGHVQVYSLTPISLWNASALGVRPSDLLARLAALSQYAIPAAVSAFITETMGRWGALILRKEGQEYVLDVHSTTARASLMAHPELAAFFSKPVGSDSFLIEEIERGPLKLALIDRGMPVVDLAGYCDGDKLFDSPWDRDKQRRFSLRDYQSEAVDSFLGSDAASGGSGVIVLPCGAGKTLVGGEILAALQMKTLILTANIVAAKQWKSELIDKMGIPSALIGEYHGQSKQLLPITIATYQILSKKSASSQQYEHLNLANSQNWGLVIYDEVHMLPAELFRMTSQLQAKRRLGLTATLVREDNKEPQVFSLIGPKRYEVPWRILEQQGWIAKARCYEIRVPFSRTDQALHDAAEKRHRFRIAAENRAKVAVISRLLAKHSNERVLIIGTFVEHINSIAKELGWPVLDGASTQKKRDDIFGRFRSGDIRGVVVSKIANTSIDLPDASMIIQVSGQFGSRQEEAQRLGRALRPKAGDNQALFFSVVTENSAEEPFADNRQKFLLEQGYEYERIPWTQVCDPQTVAGSIGSDDLQSLSLTDNDRSENSVLVDLTPDVVH